MSCGIRNSGISDNVDIIACEPETAAPFAASRFNGEITQIDYRKTDIGKFSGSGDFIHHFIHRTSFCESCGTTNVLPNMWKLANTNFPEDSPLIAHGETVALSHIESAIACLLEKHKTVAEGAGACSLAAAMFGQKAMQYDRAVVLVSGGSINNELLLNILRNVDESNSKCGRGDRYLNHATLRRV